MKVILATDGSEVAEKARREVAGRRWPEGTLIRVLTVAEPVYPPGEALPATASATYAPMMEVLTEQAEATATRVADSLSRPGVRVEWEVLFGDPAREIVECADRWGADLIVLGTHGRKGLRRLVLGSVAEYVVRHAPCSVEVVRGTVPAELEDASFAP